VGNHDALANEPKLFCQQRQYIENKPENFRLLVFGIYSISKHSIQPRQFFSENQENSGPEYKVLSYGLGCLESSWVL
jgi:hypothetical protein